MKENLTRILIGLLAVFIISQMATFFYPSFEASDDVPSSDIDSHFVRVVVIGFVLSFFATAVGGFIARAKFVVPAMAYAAAEFAYGVFRGFTLTADSSQVRELDFSFLPWVLLSLIAILANAAAGSFVGMKLFAVVNSRRVEVQ